MTSDLLPDLTGKVVVVAGATGAAGPPLVRRLARAGAVVVAVDREQSALDAVATSATAEAPGAVVDTAVVDLLDETATWALAADVLDRHGRVDGLAHLVGGWRGGKGIVESDLADWDLLERLLIRTLQQTTRAFHDGLRESGGRLCIVSSVQAQEPTATNASYAAAKAAAEAWTLAVADSFSGSDAAAVILTAKALLTPGMREAKPNATFRGYTDVDDLADAICGLWDVPAAELNGTRRLLVPGDGDES